MDNLLGIDQTLEPGLWRRYMPYKCMAFSWGISSASMTTSQKAIVTLAIGCRHDVQSECRGDLRHAA